MDIFIINTSSSDNISAELMEKFRHKDFTNKKKEKEHCFAYLMLDRILKDVYKIENRKIEFINEKPYLEAKEKYFSISHSEGYVLIAFSNSKCGVDVERIKERDYKAIAERMNFKVKTLEDFYKEWTKYEAEYKLGSGDKYKSIKQIISEDYAITAVSENSQETFEIYIQNGDNFSNP